MNCDQLRAILDDRSKCQHTDIGTKFTTHCLYPSFERVDVFISPMGDAYRVTDGGGAMRSVLQHGKDMSVMGGVLQKAAKAHMVDQIEGMLLCKPPSQEWLYSAILAVANASAMAANLGLDAVVAADENELKQRIFETLTSVIPPANVARQYEFRGDSGNLWKLDFAVVREKILLVKAVSPHRNSVNANYATFSDIGDAPNLVRYSVFDRSLKSEDRSLIGRVAQLVPFASVAAGAALTMKGEGSYLN